MNPNRKPRKKALGIVGLGNTIAGDDGVGIMVMHSLQAAFSSHTAVFFHELTGDLLEMADLIDRAGHFVFCDAIVGKNPGEIKIITDAAPPRSFTPSFHQTGIESAMRALRTLSVTTPFPHWEIWGIVIDLPRHFTSDLTPRIARSVNKCAHALEKRIETILKESGVRGFTEPPEGLFFR